MPGPAPARWPAETKNGRGTKGFAIEPECTGQWSALCLAAAALLRDSAELLSGGAARLTSGQWLDRAGTGIISKVSGGFGERNRDGNRGRAQRW